MIRPDVVVLAVKGNDLSTCMMGQGGRPNVVGYKQSNPALDLQSRCCSRHCLIVWSEVFC